MFKHWPCLAILMVVLAAPAAYADNDFTVLDANVAATRNAAAKEGWQGSATLGYVATTGNTNTRSLNARALAAYRLGNWANALSFQALQGSTNGVTSSESYDFNGQSDYSLTASNYLFGSVDYLRNTFASYRRRTTEVVGVGWRVLATNTQQVDIELGGGARQTHFTDNTSETEFIEHLAAGYLWKFTDKSNFSETLTLDHGAFNTYLQSVTALTTNLAGNFALALSYTINNNSHPLSTFKHTDTVTSVSLVYTF
ncbi:MAG: DUF481 domain-containing protein [Gammaproteobacteria bacterium]